MSRQARGVDAGRTAGDLSGDDEDVSMLLPDDDRERQYLYLQMEHCTNDTLRRLLSLAQGTCRRWRP